MLADLYAFRVEHIGLLRSNAGPRPEGGCPTDCPEILVVDDEPGIRLLLTHCLEDEGYSVTRAADGEQALAACAKVLPDLMVLDLNMPGMNGFRVLEAMEQRGWSQFPVLVVSGHYGAARKLAGIVDAIMTKPFSLEEFCRQVKALLDAPREQAPLRSG